MESLRTCKLFGVIRAVLGIKGALPLIHGPVGCFYHIRYLLSMRSSRPVRILSTEMDQNDVVFGAEEKLMDKIRAADEKYSPELIAVLSSCASSIIGENIDKVIDDIKDNINADLICINSGGFEGTQIDGYQECLSFLIGLMEKHQHNNLMDSSKNTGLMEKSEHRTESVNLVGQYRGGPDLKILKQYFNRLEIDLNCVLTAGSTLHQIKRAPKASLNISMCEASGVEPCELMERKFGIPYLQETLPLGVRTTSNFLNQICNKLNIKYPFKKEELKAKNEIIKYKPFFNDKKAAVVAGATRALALTDFLSEIGIDPVLICLDFEGKYTNIKLNNLIEQNNIHPTILKQPEYSDILTKARELKPDIILGGMGELGLSREFNKPLFDVMHAHEVTFGFDGAVKMVEKINMILQENKIA